MSKSLGNSPDPLDLIAKYGADGVRAGMLYSSPAGNDLLFDESLCEQGRNFTNKIWNAFRLIKGWEVVAGANEANKSTIAWFDSRCNQVMVQLEDHYSKYRISDALMTIYKLIWDDFCAWYLEMIKPEYIDGKGQPIDQATYDATIAFLERLMKLLHPIMPFITEEIYQLIAPRADRDSICIAAYPDAGAINETLLNDASLAFEVITSIREVRAKAQKKNHETVDVYVSLADAKAFEALQPKIVKLARLGKLEGIAAEKQGLKTIVVRGYKLYIDTGVSNDEAGDREKLIKELEYTRGFLASVEKKLSNEKFLANAAPAVLQAEQKKKQDAMDRIALLEESV
jgi:valyl-tRNA synthetase